MENVVIRIFTDIVKKTERHSRHTSKGAVFAGTFTRTLKNLLQKPVFKNGTATWIHDLNAGTKHYNNTKHFSTKLTPI